MTEKILKQVTSTDAIWKNTSEVIEIVTKNVISRVKRNYFNSSNFTNSAGKQQISVFLLLQ